MPEEAARRRRLGRVYYRPPGGESWVDVALRLRAALGDLRHEHAGRRVLIVAHEAVAYVLWYLVEGLTLAQLAELPGQSGLDNGSLTPSEAEIVQIEFIGVDKVQASESISQQTLLEGGRNKVSQGGRVKAFLTPGRWSRARC